MSKKVNKFSTTGELIGTYKSITEAAKDVGVTKETISMVCNGKRNSAAGFLWSFEDKVDVPKDDEECIWKDIKGYEGVYQMSENREVRKLPTTVTQTNGNGKEYTRNIVGGILKQCVDAEGYLAVTLDRNKLRIHWLYYNTFIGDSTGMIVDHIDRNKLNNDPSNLRLVTSQQSNYNRTLPYKPDITDFNKYYQKKHNGKMNKPFCLYFSENGKRKCIGYFKTYEEAENKYRELYNERQKRYDSN